MGRFIDATVNLTLNTADNHWFIHGIFIFPRCVGLFIRRWHHCNEAPACGYRSGCKAEIDLHHGREWKWWGTAARNIILCQIPLPDSTETQSVASREINFVSNRCCSAAAGAGHLYFQDYHHGTRRTHIVSGQCRPTLVWGSHRSASNGGAAAGHHLYRCGGSIRQQFGFFGWFASAETASSLMRILLAGGVTEQSRVQRRHRLHRAR